MLPTKSVTLISILILIYITSSVIPFKIGIPFPIFFAVLFYYAIGWASIAVYYVLFTFDLIGYAATAPMLGETMARAFEATYEGPITQLIHQVPILPHMTPIDILDIMAWNLKIVRFQILNARLTAIFQNPWVILSLYAIIYVGMIPLMLIARMIIKRKHIADRLFPSIRIN